MDALPMLAPINALFFAGDSNCLVYRHRIADRPDLFARPFVTRELYVPGFGFADGAHGTSRFDSLMTALEQERIAVRRGKIQKSDGSQQETPQWFVRTQLTKPQHDLMNTVSVDPAVVLFAGSLDVSNVLARLGPHFDFWFENKRYDPAAFAYEPVVALTPRGIVDAIVSELIDAFRTGVLALVEAGVDNLMIHSLHPPSLDSDRYFRIRGVQSLARARYKIVLLFNERLSQLAQECNVGFLDLWDRTTDGNVLDSRYSFDGDHLNLDAALLTVNEVFNALLLRRGRPLPRIPTFLKAEWSH